MIWVLLSLFGLLATRWTDDDPLARYRWKQRLVLVFAPVATSPQRAEQRRLLQARQRDADARELLVLDVLPTTPGAVKIRQRFGVRPDEFRVLLIGKDGGEKYRSDQPVPAQDFFDRIDAMPMRQQERGSRP
jgi:hypothetical protein